MLLGTSSGHVRAMLQDGCLGIEAMIRETVYLVKGRDHEGEPPLSEAQADEIVERLWLELLDERAGFPTARLADLCSVRQPRESSP
ncbi:hypothetical protein ACFY9S_19675 [Streptomyces sp. NPDC012474]|uniref:hypothetical protein n=1 Tax=Streptomyces sp. NPDC012474 TaxID=3364836 RepID=UPI0036E3CA57